MTLACPNSEGSGHGWIKSQAFRLISSLDFQGTSFGAIFSWRRRRKKRRTIRIYDPLHERIGTFSICSEAMAGSIRFESRGYVFYLSETGLDELLDVFIPIVFARTDLVCHIFNVKRSISCRPEFLDFNTFQFLFSDHFLLIVAWTRNFLMVFSL